MSDYIHTHGRNFLILKRDWSKFNGEDVPATEPCYFCGVEHMHGGGSGGHRSAHCASPVRTYIANDGTKLSSDDGYWIMDINKP